MENLQYRRLIRSMRKMPKRKVKGPSETPRGGWELECGHVIYAPDKQAEAGELRCPWCPPVRALPEGFDNVVLEKDPETGNLILDQHTQLKPEGLNIDEFLRKLKGGK